MPTRRTARHRSQHKRQHRALIACVSPVRMANFENPNHNVGLPVFTIHGNHDDPAGVDNLSAVDLLSSAGLVNYFGKTARSFLCSSTCRYAYVSVSS